MTFGQLADSFDCHRRGESHAYLNQKGMILSQVDLKCNF